jgi:hypothetical protein
MKDVGQLAQAARWLRRGRPEHDARDLTGPERGDHGGPGSDVGREAVRNRVDQRLRRAPTGEERDLDPTRRGTDATVLPYASALRQLLSVRLSFAVFPLASSAQ